MEELQPNIQIVSDVKQLILQSRQKVAATVNSEITLLYWLVGRRVNDEILKNSRAEYGKQIISTLSRQLTQEYGTGWSEKQLLHCIRFAEVFKDEQILYALRRELTWTHIRTIIYVDDELKRSFYIEMCRLERWSSRTLQERIKSMLYERTAISKLPEVTIQNDLQQLQETSKLTQELVFRDPYILDFLGLADTYSEKDLESSILAELQRFIIEMGSDFAFLARQKRIVIDNRDYYIDLLFYHRRLKSLVAIDLKIGEFVAGFKGQMELYLRYLQKYEMVEGENLPIGLILCSGKSEEHVELMQLDKSNIRVADYLIQLPPKEVLQAKLHQSIEIARNKLLGNKQEE
jgi:predicted nuclease of restriction endonuclease-like (RecB) superfamily